MLSSSGIGKLTPLFTTKEGHQSKAMGTERWLVSLCRLDHGVTEICKHLYNSKAVEFQQKHYYTISCEPT